MPDALRVEGLELGGFRNLTKQRVAPGPHFNVVHGDNGAGKSSLLEALYYAATLRSFRTSRNEDLIQSGADEAVVRVAYSGGLPTPKQAVLLRRGGRRQVRWNGKRPPSLGQYLTKAPVVLFHPGHLALASGGPDGRRRFLDHMLEQLDPTYLTTLKSYDKALRSRNRLLKGDTQPVQAIRAFHPILAEAGAVVGQSRRQLMTDLTPLIEEAFAAVTDAALPLTVRYAPKVEPDSGVMRDALESQLRKDMARGFTGAGPHLDEVVFEVSEDHATARQHASQGQQRALVLALKMAELQVLGQRMQRTPILLLDDVSSELDRTRNRRLFDHLAQLGGQVFLTTTHPEYILLEQGRVDFHVADGEVQKTT